MKRNINTVLKTSLIYLLFLCWFIHGTGWSQTPISLSASVDKSTITIGDIIKYTITVKRDENVDVKLPALGENLGGFEIRDYEVHDPRKEDGQIIDQVDYTISTFETGEFEIPPVAVRYTIPPDTTQQVLKTESLEIVVESVKPSEQGDIKGIKPPWEINFDWKWVIVIGSIVLLGLLIAGGIIYVVRKKRKGESIIPRKIEPPRPPHDVAYEELEALAGSDLLQNGAIKEYYSKISEIIRRYIEGRYQVMALELTTTELMDQLGDVSIEDEHLELFQEFMELCDLVKFAKYTPDEDENQKVMQLAYQIVDETKWVEPVEEEEIGEEGTQEEPAMVEEEKSQLTNQQDSEEEDSETENIESEKDQEKRNE